MLGKHRWHPDSLTRVVSLYGWPLVWMNWIRPNISQTAESKQMRSLLTPEIRGSNPYISNFYSQSTVLKRLKYRKRGREWAKKETNEDPKSILPERWQQYIGWRLLRQNVKIFSKSLLLPASHLISGIINGLRDLHICVGLGVYVCVFESSKWKDGGRYNTRYMVRDHFSKGLVVFLVRQIWFVHWD